MYTIYVIKSLVTGKKYFGKTKNLYKRKERHFCDLGTGKHHNSILQAEFNKYGKNQFVCESIKKFEDESDACKLEEFLIAEAQAKGEAFNIGRMSKGGDNLTMNPDKVSIKRRIKQSLLLNAKSLSVEERKLKWGRPGESNPMFGKNHTEYVRLKLRIRMLGTAFMKGKKLSVENKKQISERAKLRVGPLNTFYGKKHSAETKRMLSEGMKGKKPTNMRKVTIDGVVFESVTSAARAIKVCPGTIIFRIKSKYFNYEYL